MTIPSQLNPGPPRSQTPETSRPSPNVSNQKIKEKEREHQNRRPSANGKARRRNRRRVHRICQTRNTKQNDDHDRAWLVTDIQKMIEAACAKTVKGALAARAHSAASPQVITAPGLSLQHESHQRMMDVCFIFSSND